MFAKVTSKTATATGQIKDIWHLLNNVNIISWQYLEIMPNNLLNSSLMMSLRAGALKVSGGPNAISREEVSMATQEVGTTQRDPSPGAWRTGWQGDLVPPITYKTNPQAPNNSPSYASYESTNLADPRAWRGKKVLNQDRWLSSKLPGKQWGLCSEGVLHGTWNVLKLVFVRVQLTIQPVS